MMVTSNVAGPCKRVKVLEMLLNCALAEPDEALERWRDVLAAKPVEDFEYPEQRLLPAVLKNLRLASGPIPQEGKLKSVRRYTWARNVQLQKRCRDVLFFLQAKRIDCLVLKGIYLNLAVHQDMGVRPATDFDILVPWKQAQKALDLLLSQGWRVKGQWRSPMERLEHAVTLEKDRFELDLHWALLREARTPSQDDIFWEEAVAFHFDDLETRTLSPTHHLFHLIVAANRERLNWVRYFFDIVTLLQRFPNQIQFQKLVSMLEKRHLLSCLDALPIEKLDASPLSFHSRPSLLDKLWSQSTQIFEGDRGEWQYLLFPFLDYGINYRNSSEPDWTFLTYFKKRVELKSFSDFVQRTRGKVYRLVRNPI